MRNAGFKAIVRQLCVGHAAREFSQNAKEKYGEKGEW